MKLQKYNKYVIQYTIALLFGILLLFFCHLSTVKAEVTPSESTLHLYFNFFDSTSGDTNETRGLYSREVKATHVENYLEAQINDWPAIYNLKEVEGYPKVLINYGDVSGREVDITEHCHYDSYTGLIRIPIEYKEEYLTIKSVMSDTSMTYQDLVPDSYKVNKSETPSKLRKPASDTAVFEVIAGSSNDATALLDISGYSVGDQITVQSGYIQTLNRRENPHLYDQTGTAAYRGYQGEGIGYAISFDCSTHSAFSNIGFMGNSGNALFPTSTGYSTIEYSNRNWMYARCITDDSNYFDGNPMFTGGKIYVTGKDADGTLTCWVELYASGPEGEAAQNVGMYFRLHPPAQSSHNLTINKSIHQSDLWWAHGKPSFLFTVSGKDTDGYAHHYQRILTFTPDNISGAAASDGLITLSTTIEDIPGGSYSIQEQKVSRFALTNITAQTDNISISKSNYGKSYGGIQPIKAVVTADLTEKDGVVTFFNRKITWDKFSHKDAMINSFVIQK